MNHFDQSSVYMVSACGLKIEKKVVLDQLNTNRILIVYTILILYHSFNGPDQVFLRVNALFRWLKAV